MNVNNVTDNNIAILPTKIQKKNFNKNNNKFVNNPVNLNNSPNAIYNIAFGANISKPLSIVERYEGCLLGGALGDAFGAPIEKDSMQYIKYKFKGNLNHLLKNKDGISEFSDDTQMTLFTIEGLTKAVLRFPTDSVNFYKEILKSYQNWYKTQMQDVVSDNSNGLMSIPVLYKQRAPGDTCLNAIKSGKFGTISAPINDSAGNGGIMRIAPVGLLYSKNPDVAFKVGASIAALTHGNVRAYLPAGYMSALISNLSNGKNLMDAINDSNKILSNYPEHKGVLDKINLALELSQKDINDAKAIEKIGAGWTGDEALAIALFSNLRHMNNFKHTIISAANHSGDSDTTAAIAGNISGIINGTPNIPTSWKKSVQLKELLSQYAKYLNILSNVNLTPSL